MVKNVPKMAKIISGTSYMVDNNIFNIFSFFNFFLRILFRPCFLEFFLKIQTNYRGSTVPKKKVEKQKKVKMSLFIIYEAPKIISSIFLSIFDNFYPISPAIFAPEQKFAIDHFRDPPILDRLGK